MESMKSVILAGGVGTRLWPLSRTYNPKQFLKMNGTSLFQETYKRAMRLSKPEDIYVVTHRDHHYLALNQIEELNQNVPDGRILSEPVGKNTLPAITWAILEIEKESGESLVAVFPSDHYLGEDAMDEIAAAGRIAGDFLVTFGIPPTHPHTGYGYIAPGDPLSLGFRVSRGVILQFIRGEGDLSDGCVDDPKLVDLKVDFTLFHFLDGFAHIHGDGAAFRVGHQAAGTQDAPEGTNLTHHGRHGDDHVDIGPSAFDFLDILLETYKISARIFGFLLLVGGNQSQYPDLFSCSMG